MSYSQTEKDKIQVALCGLWETLDKTGKVMSMPKQRGYLMAFEVAGLSVDQIEFACAIATARCKWFPMPSELIELVFGSDAQQCESAWNELLLALSSFSSAHEIYISNPTLAMTIRSMGGLSAIAQRSIADDNWTRKQFNEVYRSFFGANCRPMTFVAGKKLSKDQDGNLLSPPIRKVIGGDSGVTLISHQSNSAATELAGQLRIEQPGTESNRALVNPFHLSGVTHEEA